ncbi:MAG: DUF4337 domain-containing protein [Chitinophagales bacterium]
MTEDKKEKWLLWLPATTVLFAVCATLSTFKGGGFSNKSVLNQAKASDQWAFYQAKSIKSYLSEMQKENLELDLYGLKDTAYTSELKKRINSYQDKIKKYSTEKDEITRLAKDLEAQQVESKKHADAFGMGVIFLQISILLSSIGALVKKSPLWYLSIVVGLIGIVCFLNGFFLFF